MSMAKTRLRRCIQLIGAVGLSLSTLRRERCGTMRLRCLKLGANTPWKRVRLSLRRGTSAASLAIKSNGSNTTCVDPSRNGCL